MAASEESTSPSDPSSNDASALRVQHLEVRQFHGLHHGLEVDLCDDLTVVYGANASGKTTLAQAVQALLWPDRVEDSNPDVSAQFVLDGTPWHVSLDGRGCSYQKEQQPASSPALPPPSHASRYHLYLHDLLRGGEDEQDFARLILQEAQGGIDVAGAARELGFEVPTRRASKATRAVEEARSALRETRSAQEALRDEEKRLDALREQRAEAQAAAERAAALEQAVEVAKARAAHDEAAAALDAFPDVLSEVRGDEIDRLETLQEQRRTAQKTAEDAANDRDEAQQTIAQSRIPASGLPEGRLEELRSATDTLREQERTVRELKSDLEKAASEEQSAWDQLSAGVDREAAAAIDLPQVEAVERHVTAVEDLRGRQEMLATAKTLFAEAEPDVPVDSLRDGLHRLHRWLQSPAPEAANGRGVWDVVLLTAGVLVAAGGVGLVVLAAGPARWIGGGGALLGAVVVLAELMRERGASEGEESRALHRREFERLDLAPPSDWRRAAVEERADAVLERLRAAAVAAAKRDEWQRLRSTREEVTARAEDLDEERQRLAEEIGLDPDVSSRSLSWLFDRLAQWQRAYAEREGTRAALETARTEAEACRSRLDDQLAPFDLGPVEDASEAQGAVETVQSAWETVREAQRTVEQAEERRASAEADRTEAEETLSALYDRLALDEGDEEALRALVAQHEEYEAAVEAERTARTTLEAEKNHLRRLDGSEDWMAEAAVEDLRQDLEAARAEAEREDEYVDRIKDIEHRIRDAREGGTLEQRRAEYRRARTDLAEARSRDYERAVGQVLADLVQEATHDRGLPPVFHRARALFAEITNDRYELTLDKENAVFGAYDHVSGKPFALDALSSGTKVQLLLSVRVAFVDTQEQGCRAPLVLDEALATSDDQRAQALIDAVRTICRDGRQVIYLTAQADEVQKWRAGLEGDEALDHTVVALSDLDERAPSGSGDGAAVPVRNTPSALPDPDTTAHSTLRKELDVPRWTPRQSLSRLHLWYLLESPPALLDRLRAGIRTWGQLRFQRQRGGTAATGLSEDRFAHVRALARAVDSWKEAWQVGRGQPVTRAALEDTDAVTSTFLDGVSALADELDGDAAALLRVIRTRSDERVQGFYSSKADDLEAYLREHGYLDPRDRHPPADMWQYVLADLAEARTKGIVALDDLERLFDRLAGETPERPAE